VIPPRSIAAGVPAKVLRALTETELAWKVEGTRSYQDLTRRSLATMQAVAPLSQVQPGRRRLELPELLPLSTVKKREQEAP
jgi:phenylacetic acid degradation protein